MGILGDLARAFAAENSRKPNIDAASTAKSIDSSLAATSATSVSKQSVASTKQEIQIINPQPSVIPVDAGVRISIFLAISANCNFQ
jgi:hypothetical protein